MNGPQARRAAMALLAVLAAAGAVLATRWLVAGLAAPVAPAARVGPSPADISGLLAEAADITRQAAR